MDLGGAIATVVAAFLGGGLGAMFAARITGQATVNAAGVGAATARAIAEGTQADAAADREATRRAWLNERSREIASELITQVDRHNRQVGAMFRRRQEVASGVGAENSIPRVDPTD